MPSALSWSVALLVSLGALGAAGCTPGGVGDPCVPEDEYQQTFSGFQVSEVNVESRSFQCETRVCLVNHFQGRVSCKLGQKADPNTNEVSAENLRCSVPGTKVGDSQNNITVQVPAQLTARQTDKAVYCSCRCDGAEKNARYCECPSGFKCSKLLDDLQIKGSGKTQLAGSYCVKNGTEYNPNDANTKDGGTTCADRPADCKCDKPPGEDCGRL